MTAQANAKSSAIQVGFAGRTVPRELIRAAGLVPVELRGDPTRATPLADQYMERLFDPAVRSIFQQLLEGKHAGLSAIVLPRSEDSLHRLYYYLCELRRTGMVPALPQPVLYDLLRTPWPSSAAYNLARTGELCTVLGGFGAALSETKLAEAFADRQARDRELEKLLTLRRTHHMASGDWRLLRDAAEIVPPQAFSEKISQLRLEKPRAIRVLLAGSVLDDPALHEFLEAVGASVVADYTLRDRPARRSDGPAHPPLESLSHYDHFAVPSARTYPSDANALAKAAKESGATHCISYLYAHEEGLSWDYPAEAAALAEAGIPVLALHDQPYRVPVDVLGPTIEKFLRNGGA